MPPVRITRSQNVNGGAPAADVTPEEAAQIRASVAGREQAPSVRVQSIFKSWRDVADQLGDPFETERIPLSKLRQMRRDPMLGFGLSFIKTEHVTAKWFVNAKSSRGPNAQVAAHLDHDLRRIYGSFIFQWTNSIDFGFQAIAKRFEFRVPSGTYIDIDPETGEETERPIWSEGGIQPIAWKPFVALRPEGVEPVWDKSTGEFAGIEYTPSGNSSGGGVPAGTGASQTSGGKGGTDREQTYKIDLPHSLWVTNEKDANFGSIFGYPRLGYAYRYWWSYWFRWAIADRAFERKADPSVIVRHPQGKFINDDTGETLDYGEYAIMMGERMRSGGVIALPSDVYEDANGRGTVREWDIEFTRDAVNFDPFDKSFEYLDVQKLRSLFIPEQAFLEGKGGTSSRNVAASMEESFTKSQAVLNSQIVETINRWVIPQWLAVNYPEFVADGGTAYIVMQGFGEEDRETITEIIRLLAQSENGAQQIMSLVDLRKILADRGIPIVSHAEYERRKQEAIQRSMQSQPPAVAPVPGEQVGVVPTATGFSYIQPQDAILFSASGTDFIESLPDSPHYEDKAVRGFARQLWILYRDLYRDEYESAIAALADDAFSGADDDVEFADYTRRARRLIARWAGSAKWPRAIERSTEIMKRLMKRAARIELRRAKARVTLSDQEIEEWLTAHLDEVAASVADTTRSEIQDFLARQIEAGRASRDELATAIREHFAEFPRWKADRFARTEVRDVYNAATLLAAQAAGIDRVQALDAQLTGVNEHTDNECEDRAGQIFTVTDAFKEREHPNGTLGWRMVPVELSIERREFEDGAYFDEKTSHLTLSDQLDPAAERKILLSVVEAMIS